MQTVVETNAYLRAAQRAGMTEEEREFVVNYLSERPDEGDLLVGSCGIRKLRIAGKGKGKSGGYRVLTFYKFGDWPVSCSMFSPRARNPT